MTAFQPGDRVLVTHQAGTECAVVDSVRGRGGYVQVDCVMADRTRCWFKPHQITLLERPGA